MGGSAKPAPSVLGVHSAMCLPLGTYRNAMRLGAALPGAVPTAQLVICPIASSQGKEIAAPMPRRRVRREIGLAVISLGPFLDEAGRDRFGRSQIPGRRTCNGCGPAP